MKQSNVFQDLSCKDLLANYDDFPREKVYSQN